MSFFSWRGLDKVKRGRIRQLTYHNQHQYFVLGCNDARGNCFHIAFNCFVWQTLIQCADAKWLATEACHLSALWVRSVGRRNFLEKWKKHDELPDAVLIEQQPSQGTCVACHELVFA